MEKVRRRRLHLHRHRRQHVPGGLSVPRRWSPRSPGPTSTTASTARRPTRPSSTSRACATRSRCSARSPAQADEGWVNRAWNDTTNTVITGKALMQIHGDWMKGEWQRHKQGARRGLRLHQHPRHQGAVGDGRLPSASSAASPRTTLKAELDFAAIVVDPEDQRRVRRRSRARARCALDVPTDKLDACNKLVLEFAEEAGLQRAEPVLHRRPRLA